MKIKSQNGREEYNINIIRKDIKHSYLRVDYETGDINLTTNPRTSSKEIESIILDKLDWIRESMEKLREKTYLGRINYKEGEKVYLWGKAYILKFNYLDSGPYFVEVEEDRITLNLGKSTEEHRKDYLLKEFYREELMEKTLKYVLKYEEIMGLEINEVRTKDMKTRWGTCNIGRKRIWINLQLARLDEKYLEYIVVHEMVHLFERGHGEKFKAKMDIYMENWRELDRELSNYIIV